MTGILDVCVPSRRRERRRQRQLQDGLHSRFGDISISSPSEGAWSQPGNETHAVHEWNTETSLVHGSPDTQRTLVDSSPEPDHYDDKVIIVDDSYTPPPIEVKERNTFTITIPLPWSAKRTHSRASSTATHPTAPNDPPRSEELEWSPPLPSTSPPIIYKPASEAHLQELAKIGACDSAPVVPWNFGHPIPSPPTAPIDTARAHNVSPSFTILSPVSENFAKGTNDNHSPSPVPTVLSIPANSLRSASPPVQAIENFSRPRIPTPQLSSNTYDTFHPLLSNPPPRRGSTVERPHTAGGQYSSSEGLERSATSMSSRPPTRRPGTAMSSRSTHVGRSSSRGPAEDNAAAIAPPTSPTIDRTGTAVSSRSVHVGRSSSRRTREDRIGTTRARSSSRGPGLEELGYMRSSSHEPTGRRAMSRDRRGPNSRAASRESTTRRASSRARSVEPVSRHIERQESSASSESGSDMTYLEDEGDNRPQRNPSSATTVTSSSGAKEYVGNCAGCAHCNCVSDGGRQEYVHVGRAENLFSESEDESSSSSWIGPTAKEPQVGEGQGD